MDEPTEPAGTKPETGVLSGGFPAWLVCVLFSVVPLVLFLLTLETFTAGTIDIEGLLSKESLGGEQILSPLARGQGGIALFRYSVLVFVHVLICLFVGLHFMSRISTSDRRGPAFLFCFVFSATVIAAVIAITVEDTAFRGYMIEPLSIILTKVGVPLPAFPMFDANDSVDTFLALSLIAPTSLGIIVVVLATCSFHSALFFSRSRWAERHRNALESAATILRHDLIALSIVLVSSVITARAYFTIAAGVFASADHVAAAFYGDLAKTLSTGSGLLFSATLFAAFAPGVIALTAVPGDGSKPKSRRSHILSGLAFRPGPLSERFKGIWQPITAFVAPAVSAPLLDLLSGFVG